MEALGLARCVSRDKNPRNSTLVSVVSSAVATKGSITKDTVLWLKKGVSATSRAFLNPNVEAWINGNDNIYVNIQIAPK